MNESQLRTGNNDGMDPYWKPEPAPKLKMVVTIERVFYSLVGIVSKFDKYKDEDLEKLKANDMVVQLTFTPEQIKELREIIKAAR